MRFSKYLHSFESKLTLHLKKKKTNIIVFSWKNGHLFNFDKICILIPKLWDETRRNSLIGLHKKYLHEMKLIKNSSDNVFFLLIVFYII